MTCLIMDPCPLGKMTCPTEKSSCPRQGERKFGALIGPFCQHTLIIWSITTKQNGFDKNYTVQIKGTIICKKALFECVKGKTGAICIL